MMIVPDDRWSLAGYRNPASTWRPGTEAPSASRVRPPARGQPGAAGHASGGRGGQEQDEGGHGDSLHKLVIFIRRPEKQEEVLSILIGSRMHHNSEIGFRGKTPESLKTYKFSLSCQYMLQKNGQNVCYLLTFFSKITSFTRVGTMNMQV